ncbi:hypothetical protein N824_20455 [Pedobacter sp. V48]|nr:hypothetical protein N824_20455 [Pedobacter sp. V48]
MREVERFKRETAQTLISLIEKNEELRATEHKRSGDK